MSSHSTGRIVKITAALALTGAVVGGMLGAVLVTLLAARIRDVHALGTMVGTGAMFGATMGFVLAPVAAWTLMRRVPIWRAISETAIGTLGGATIGLIFQPRYNVGWLSPVYLGIAGFVLAAVRLRVAVGRRDRASRIDATANER